MCIVVTKKADGTTEKRIINQWQFQPTGRVLDVDQRRAAPSPRPTTVRDECIGTSGGGMVSSARHYYPRGKMR